MRLNNYMLFKEIDSQSQQGPVTQTQKAGYQWGDTLFPIFLSQNRTPSSLDFPTNLSGQQTFYRLLHDTLRGKSFIINFLIFTIVINTPDKKSKH
jgi:hypothetical protein